MPMTYNGINTVPVHQSNQQVLCCMKNVKTAAHHPEDLQSLTLLIIYTIKGLHSGIISYEWGTLVAERLAAPPLPTPAFPPGLLFPDLAIPPCPWHTQSMA